MLCIKMEKLKSEFSVSNFGLRYGRPRDFVTAQCGPLIVYPVFTVVMAIYHFAWIIVEIWWSSMDPPGAGTWFIYLTNQGYTILVAFQWLDCIMTLYVHKARKDLLEDNGNHEDIPWYLKALWVIYNIICAGALIIFLAYWILLEASFSAGSVNKHLMNYACVLLVVCVSAKPTRILHFYQPTIFGIWYVIFSAIYQHSGGGLIYDILDWSDPGKAIALTFPLALVAIPLCHLFFYAAFRIRGYIASRCHTKQMDIKVNGTTQVPMQPAEDTWHPTA